MNRFIALIVVVLAFTGCSSYKSVTVSERERISPEQQVYKIETTTGEFVEFEGDPLGYAVLKPGGIERLMSDGTVTTIPFSTIKTIYTRETNFLSTTGGIILISAVVAVVVVVALGGISFHGI